MKIFPLKSSSRRSSAFHCETSLVIAMMMTMMKPEAKERRRKRHFAKFPLKFRWLISLLAKQNRSKSRGNGCACSAMVGFQLAIVSFLPLLSSFLCPSWRSLCLSFVCGCFSLLLQLRRFSFFCSITFTRDLACLLFPYYDCLHLSRSPSSLSLFCCFDRCLGVVSWIFSLHCVQALALMMRLTAVLAFAAMGEAP